MEAADGLGGRGQAQGPRGYVVGAAMGGAAASSRGTVETLPLCTRKLAGAYMELEASVAAIVQQPGQVAPELQQACLGRLQELHATCDRLRQAAERQKDIVSVESALLDRSDKETRESPQDVVHVRTENLFVSRAEFQKVIL